MNKIRYNFEYLQNYCNKNNVELIENYTYTHRDTQIKGKCKTNNCNNVFSKTLKHLTITGAYCKSCILNLAKEKRLNYNINKYGVQHTLQLDNVKAKTKTTNLEKYGVDNPMKNKIIKEKAYNTNIQKYGVKYILQSEEIKNKVKKTNIKNFGVEYLTLSPECREKAKITYINNFGYENPLICPEIKEKIKKTNVKKFGVENPSQCPEIMDKIIKNSYKLKEYILSSGKIIKCQGYEPLALDELLQKELINEDDIVTGAKNVPKIWYTDEQNKKHRHYVDIFIPSQNRCIEVKSTWTAEQNKNNIFLKQQAGKDLGYKYEIWVYNAKGERVETYL